MVCELHYTDLNALRAGLNKNIALQGANNEFLI